MNADDLDSKSDAELEELFAVNVAGWTQHPAIKGFWRDAAEVPQPKNLYQFCTSADAVLPWLEDAQSLFRTMNTEETIRIFIPGIPAPGGSKRAFALRKGGVLTGRVAMVDAGGQRTKDWRQACVVMAHEKRPPQPFRGPLRVDFRFLMPRPKYHFRRDGTLIPSAPTHHVSKPDRTKLTRSTEDALKGIIWADDSQIVCGHTEKRYGDQPGCEVAITPL